MKIRVVFAVLVALFALTTVPVAAQGLTGTWNLESQTQRGTQNITLDLVQDGTDLTGTVTMQMAGRRGGGGGGRGAQEIAIENGTVSGPNFSFEYTLSFGDNAITFRMSGTYELDLMDGRIDGGRGGSRSFSGQKAS